LKTEIQRQAFHHMIFNLVLLYRSYVRGVAMNREIFVSTDGQSFCREDNQNTQNHPLRKLLAKSQSRQLPAPQTMVVWWL